MNKEAAIRNAKNELAHQTMLARIGLNFSTTTIMDCKRMLELAERFPEELTEEEAERLKNRRQRAWDPDWRDCKDIKMAYSLSWNELKEIASWII